MEINLKPIIFQDRFLLLLNTRPTIASRVRYNDKCEWAAAHNLQTTD